MATHIPPHCDQLVFAGRTSTDFCELRVRGVYAFMGSSRPPDPAACYDEALGKVASYDIESVPWGHIYLYFFGVSVDVCSFTESLVTLADAGVTYTTLSSMRDFGQLGTGPGATWFFQVRRLQVVLPPPWFIQEIVAAGDPRCLTNDSLTDPSVHPDDPGIIFAPPAGRLIDLPIPSTDSTYDYLVPCGHCTP